MLPRQPSSTLFPYTTLFRSGVAFDNEGSVKARAAANIMFFIRFPVRPRVGPNEKHYIGCCSGDRKSTRLNSSHTVISYAVSCLKKKSTLNTDLDTAIAIAMR